MASSQPVALRKLLLQAHSGTCISNSRVGSKINQLHLLTFCAFVTYFRSSRISASMLLESP
jgi:hypothetical protein